MVIYLLIILLLFFSLLFKIDKNSKRKKYWVIFIFLILTIVSAIRSYNVGVDTNQYFSAFKSIIHINWNNHYLTRYEIGFFYLNKLISLISSNPQLLLAISSCIIIPSVGNFIYRYSKNVVVSTLLYVLLNIFFFHMTGMRQSIAISILLFSIPLLENNKYIKFLIVVLLASLFHSSAIIFLIAMILNKSKYTKSSYFHTFLIMISCFLFLKPIFIGVTSFIGKYSGYINSRDFGVSNYFGALFQFLLTFIVYSFCHILFVRIRNNNDKYSKNSVNELFLKLLSVDVICQFMAMKMNIIGRMNQFFWIYSIILIPNLIGSIKSPKVKFALYSGIIVVTFTYWLIIGIYRPEWHGAIPYSVFK